MKILCNLTCTRLNDFGRRQVSEAVMLDVRYPSDIMVEFQKRMLETYRHKGWEGKKVFIDPEMTSYIPECGTASW